jgi:hypothetical protein
MFTAVVLLCAQANCFAIGGPAFKTEDECAADFMMNGVPALQYKYPAHEIIEVKCYRWEEKVKS